MARLDTRSGLARIAGVSPAAITKACKGALSEACVGKMVDLDHPAVVAYLKKKGVDPTAGRPKRSKKADPPTESRPRKRRKRRRRAPDPPATEEDDIDLPGPNEVTEEEIEAYAHLTLDELVEKFGTAVRFAKWLDARKKISEIREKDLKNDETDGRLIDREFVRTHVFGAIEAGNRRLLGDAPKTIARRLYSLAKAGAPVEEAEAVVREIISSQLRPVKTAAARGVRNA